MKRFRGRVRFGMQAVSDKTVSKRAPIHREARVTHFNCRNERPARSDPRWSLRMLSDGVPKPVNAMEKTVSAGHSRSACGRASDGRSSFGRDSEAEVNLEPACARKEG